MKPITIWGHHAIVEILRKGGIRGILYLCPDRKKAFELRQLAEERGIKIVLTDNLELERLVPGQKHRGAVLVLEEMPLAYHSDLKYQLRQLDSEQALVLLLDSITDPHNFGAILRSADQFGVDLVVVTERKSAPLTQAVVASSAGAANYVKLVPVANLVQAIELLQANNFWVYGADLRGQNLREMRLVGRIALVLGSEGMGLHRLVREACDGLLRIPAAGHVDSFNVSVAAGILLYEIRRQQGWQGSVQQGAQH